MNLFRCGAVRLWYTVHVDWITTVRCGPNASLLTVDSALYYRVAHSVFLGQTLGCLDRSVPFSDRQGGGKISVVKSRTMSEILKTADFTPLIIQMPDGPDTRIHASRNCMTHHHPCMHTHIMHMPTHSQRGKLGQACTHFIPCTLWSQSFRKMGLCMCRVCCRK